MESTQPYGEAPNITASVLEGSVRIGGKLSIVVTYRARKEGEGVRYFYWLSLTGAKERGVETDGLSHQFKVELPVTRELASLLMVEGKLRLVGFASITAIRPDDFHVQQVKRLTFVVPLEV